MGFKDSITSMLKFCIENSLVKFDNQPLTRLTNETSREPYFINITDSYGENIMYSYDKFMEIINSKGLDGFAF
ncbi:MAG: hypothetical protein E7Z93_02900 [Cyanobacteria bacterium SIG32]|nr:hypothetical protein [Cyanobacteria bacterium SIG32]